MAEQDAGILVVDDESFFREAIGDILRKQGLHFELAETGEQALEKALDTALGVVVLDVRLPDIDGIQVLARLRELRPSLRVIMLSASTDQDLVLEALRLGACDYLAKPLHEEELVLAVRRSLESYSVTSDWVRLRGRLDRLVARLEELSSQAFDRDVDAATRIGALHQSAVQAASDVLEAHKTSLVLLDDVAEELRVVAAIGSDVPPDELAPIKPGDGVVGMALQRSEPMVVEDVASDPLFAGFTHSDRYASQSFAVAPLRGPHGAFGVLCATDRSAGGRFGDDDLSLLRLLAMQLSELLTSAAEPPEVADAPDGLELGEVGHAASLSASATQVMEGPPKPEEDDGERDAELAREICQAVMDEVEPERVIAGVLRPLCALLPAAPVSLYLLDASTGQLVQEGECDGGVSGDHERIEIGRGLTGTVLQTGSLIATSDPGADPRFDPEIDTPLSGAARPMLCLPLRLRGKVVGIFRAFLLEGSAASARTAEVLAAALSAAVRSVLLYRSLVETIEEVAEARRAARS